MTATNISGVAGETLAFDLLFKDAAKAALDVSSLTITMSLHDGPTASTPRSWIHAATPAPDQDANKGLATLQLSAGDTTTPGEHYFEIWATNGSTVNKRVAKGILTLERSGA